MDTKIKAPPEHTVEPARARTMSQSAAGPAAVGVLADPAAAIVGNLALQRLLRTGSIRAKLTVSAPDDPFEREADLVADSVVSSTDPVPIQRKWNPNDGDELVQRSRVTARGAMQSPAPRILHTVLRAPGVPLSGALRGFMESRFGAAFGAVRLRADCGAAASAAAIQASAYTAGSHVAFGEGAFAPETAKRRRLIAHELAHVVQQNGHSAGPLIRRVPIDTADTSQQPFGPTAD